MESVASNSTPPGRRHHPPSELLGPSQPTVDRIVRAVSHHLLLLHRSESAFFVLGATGNVYTVSLSPSPACTCPDRATPCKHILFVFIRVLGVPLDDSCLQRRTLRPCQLQRLLATPSSPDAMAGPGLRERFHRDFFRARARARSDGAGPPEGVRVEDGAACPICLDELKEGGGERLVACGTCRNPVHEECLLRWKRSRGRRPAICVICRGRWRRVEQENAYVNLGAYVSEEDQGEGHPSNCGDLSLQ
ncbi:SWIM-type domain-containing protein [Psidium guajava]|nr:SWIM-type domain-containing protein [Psidium guajava]